jgi:hypothetical protein
MVFLCASGAAWGQDTIQSVDGRYGIVAGARGPRVADDRGASTPLNVPDGVRLRHLASLRGGWIAAGSQRVGVRDELFLRMLDPGGLKRIPAPGFQIGSMRQQPVVLSDGESILGMLWLEGDTRGRLAVRSSEWLGITWSAPVTVAEVGPGSQQALAATVLNDGSWLATWARFDGQDDEIFYSIGQGNSWTTPSPLSANSTPDILPTVAPSEHGALVAWNQYDGEEYRVVTAQLIEGRWVEGSKEGRGSLYPRFIMDEDLPTLLFYDVAGAWRLHDMDTQGSVVRRGSVHAESRDRPLVFRTRIEGEPHARVQVEWPQVNKKRRPDWEFPR